MNPPRPNRCRRYRSRHPLPTPLKPSGNTPTSSPSCSRRSASSGTASVLPIFRAMGPTNGIRNARSAASKRTWRCAGCSSSTPNFITSASIGTVPAWFETSTAAPFAGTFSMPFQSTRKYCCRRGRNSGAQNLSTSSSSKPKSSTAYSPVSRRRPNSSASRMRFASNGPIRSGLAGRCIRQNPESPTARFRHRLPFDVTARHRSGWRSASRSEMTCATTTSPPRPAGSRGASGTRTGRVPTAPPSRGAGPAGCAGPG